NLVTNPFYINVLGFSNNDAVDIRLVDFNTTLPNPLNTTGPAGGVNLVAAGDATLPFVYTSGTDVNARRAPFNLIDIITPVNAGGLTVQQAFSAAMGAGHILTGTGSQSVLVAFYDITDQQAVYVVDTTAASPIRGTDAVRVVGMVHMSQADFLS